ncbi:DUF177 domain-containing protein [Sphingomonas sp. SUN019]|uniref:YceD family protein n=1 Tax=Sphingomonas sp. SUN019 TaxID=2937788 RepID=UPI0021649634|nr:DUF177 domain-containing protein [Sphingomonas sp. SUN019]UVO51172.1 DUF177 domain-containing protein [Sphingomonas sp. SUN019]
MTPEFSRPERLDTIGDVERTVEIAANEAERTALARRFALIAIDRLTATFAIRREGTGVRATGHVSAAVTQACSVTGDPIASTVDEPVTLRFAEPTPVEEEVDLTDEALDTIEIEGGAIDLGEAAAETMALALDPFPRSLAAEQALKAAGVKSEEEAGRFGALAGLRDRLKN